MNRVVMAALSVSVAILAAPAHAQFGKLKMPGSGAESSGSSAAVPDAAAQEMLVKRFVTSQDHSLGSQVEFLKAFGLQEQVQLLEAERLALSSGSVNTDALKKTASVSEGAQKQIDAKLASKPELSAEAKKHYASGLVSLLAAGVEGKNLLGDAQKFADGVKGAGVAQAAMLASKLSAGIWVAKESPGYVKGLYESTKAAVTFARASGVEVPQNADAALDSLQ